MTDFSLLIRLQKEFVELLHKRSYLSGEFVSRELSYAKLRRLRLQIQELMLKIERDYTYYIPTKETDIDEDKTN